MHCPEDDSLLDISINIDHVAALQYVCRNCKGVFFSHIIDDSHARQKLPSRLNGVQLRCPRDKEIMQERKGHFICHLCLGVWLPNPAKIQPPRSEAAKAATEVTVLFMAGLALMGWQMGNLVGSADVVDSASVSPLKIIAQANWLVIFILIFLLPLLIYVDLLFSHRPHLKKTRLKFIIRWLPFIIIGLMVINVYFFSLL